MFLIQTIFYTLVVNVDVETTVYTAIDMPKYVIIMVKGTRNI